MKALDPRARRVLEEGVAADQPPGQLEAELWAKIAGQLAKPLPPMAAEASRAFGTPLQLASRTLFGSFAKSALGVVLGGVVAATSTAVWYAAGTTPTPPVGVSPSADPSPQGTQPAAPDALMASPALVVQGSPVGDAAEALVHVGAAVQPAVLGATESPSAAASEPPATASPETLLEEARLLARAQRALKAGAARRALGLIDPCERRFPGGQLAEECSALRVFALCALGRSSDAQREQQRFVERWPGSPLRARVASACDQRSDEPSVRAR
jgi:hypothetical protein